MTSDKRLSRCYYDSCYDNIISNSSTFTPSINIQPNIHCYLPMAQWITLPYLWTSWDSNTILHSRVSTQNGGACPCANLTYSLLPWPPLLFPTPLIWMRNFYCHNYYFHNSSILIFQHRTSIVTYLLLPWQPSGYLPPPVACTCWFSRLDWWLPLWPL